MASVYKSIEQIALYRLEFYKNKKEWNLDENMRKGPPPSTKNCNVDKTYNSGKDFPKLEYDELIYHNNTFRYPEPATHVELKPAEDPLDLSLEYQTPAEVRQAAENWLTQHGCPLKEEEYADMYDECKLVDDRAGFERGAHTAPHSSEIDLNVAQECPCSCNKSLCALSMRQLARAIQRHHAALTLLLREQALRETLSSRSHLHLWIPFEIYPTLDTEPLRTPSVLSSAQDLPSSRRVASTRPPHGLLQQHSVIGIVRGKPNRL